MPPAIATAFFLVVIVGLFVFDRDRDERTSGALWIPVIWLLLASSRMVSQWLGSASAVGTADQALEGNALDRNVLLVLIAAGMFVLLRRGQEVGALVRANVPILVFLLYCAASVMWSDYPGVAFKRWTKAVGDIVMILVVLSDPDRPAAVKRLLARIAFLLVPTSILFIKYYPGLGQVYSGMQGSVRYTGVTRDKNMLGVICLMAGLGCVWRLLDGFRQPAGSRRLRPLFAQAALLVMVLWTFRVANSMTSLACFILGMGLMVATCFPLIVRKRALVHLLVLAVLGGVLAGLFLDAGSNLVEMVGRDQDLTGRTDLWRDIFRINQSPWVGSGFESFWLGDRLEELWAIYWWHPNEAHNGYLEVFLNLGAVGVSLFAVLVAFGYRNAVAAFRNDPKTGGLKLAFFVVGLAYSFTEAGFRVLNPIWISFMLAGAAVPPLRVPDTSDAKEPLEKTTPTVGVWKVRTPSLQPVRPLIRQRATLASDVRRGIQQARFRD